MNRVDEIIQELCPEGVAHKELGEVLGTVEGSNRKIVKSKIQENGEYPVYTQGANQKPDGYSDDEEAAISDTPLILYGDHTNVLKWIDHDFIAGADGVKLVKSSQDSGLDNRFLYHCLRDKIKQIPSGYARHFAQLRKLTIPIPPLEVQKEIINILDKFTQLDAELSAELNARRRQYEYYKNTLLKPSEEVSWKTIGEVSEVGDGNHSSSYPKASEMVDQGVPFIRGTNIIDGTISGKDMKYISEEKHLKLKKGHLRANDVLVTNRGEVGKIAIVPDQFSNSNLNSQIAWLRADTKILLPRYLFFIMNANFIQNKIIGEGGALKQLTIKNLKLLKIPVPSIKKQQEIVDVLDNFDTLTNDKIVGIPAEIDARSLQYDYYRTKLLTFQELPV